MDKSKWEEIRELIVKNSHLTYSQVDELGEICCLKGDPKGLLDYTKKTSIFTNAEGKEALTELELLMRYLEVLGCLDKVIIDFSLARGLDYYTGVIYEANLIDSEEGKLGSIAGGGRYDNLIGSFTNKEIPAIGVSIGIERIFKMLEDKAMKNLRIREKETEVMVI